MTSGKELEKAKLTKLETKDTPLSEVKREQKL